MKEPIRKIELKDKTVRYRLVVDIGYDENGKRQQLARTFDKLKDARAELSRIRHETGKGTFVKPSDITVSQYLDEYLVGARRAAMRSDRDEPLTARMKLAHYGLTHRGFSRLAGSASCSIA